MIITELKYEQSLVSSAYIIIKKYRQMEFLKELKYSKEHIWLKTQGSKAAIGITEFAQIVLGKLFM